MMIGKPVAELGYKAAKSRQRGKEVFLKVIPGTLSTRADFVCKKHIIASQDDVLLQSLGAPATVAIGYGVVADVTTLVERGSV
jgi:hypothetical protein